MFLNAGYSLSSSVVGPETAAVETFVDFSLGCFKEADDLSAKSAISSCITSTGDALKSLYRKQVQQRRANRGGTHCLPCIDSKSWDPNFPILIWPSFLVGTWFLITSSNSGIGQIRMTGKFLRFAGEIDLSEWMDSGA
jgi:hypothetical protein